tara:strand:+ start:1153 stop:1482 length:330 start_codon:yes stop_codon:yes gene_type:complete
MGKVSENINKEDRQLLEVIEIIDNDDGTSEIVFEITDEFKDWFKKCFGLKRWSNKRFQKELVEAIQDYIEKETKQQYCAELEYNHHLMESVFEEEIKEIIEKDESEKKD